jgi:hypothetical protein
VFGPALGQHIFVAVLGNWCGSGTFGTLTEFSVRS